MQLVKQHIHVNNPPCINILPSEEYLGTARRPCLFERIIWKSFERNCLFFKQVGVYERRVQSLIVSREDELVENRRASSGSVGYHAKVGEWRSPTRHSFVLRVCCVRLLLFGSDYCKREFLYLHAAVVFYCVRF